MRGSCNPALQTIDLSEDFEGAVTPAPQATRNSTVCFEEAMGNWGVGIIAVLLFVYLLMAMLRPEKF